MPSLESEYKVQDLHTCIRLLESESFLRWRI